MTAENEPRWEPEWLVDVGHGSVLGVVMDDHCFVVLYPKENGRWEPGTHIPEAIARFLGSVAVPERANRYKGDARVG